MIPLLAVAAWIALLFVVVGLCAAARTGDRTVSVPALDGEAAEWGTSPDREAVAAVRGEAESAFRQPAGLAA